MNALIVVTAALLSLGLYAVLTRRDVVAVLAGVEVMLGAANVQLVAAASSYAGGPDLAQALGLFVLVVAAAEAAVGLALVIAAFRRSGRGRMEDLAEVSG